MKVVALKRSASDKKDDKGGHIGMYPGGEDGISVNVENHHLKKMGIDGELTPGHKVKIKGHGHIHMAEKDGHARLVLTHAGMEHSGEAEESKSTERAERRSDLEKAYESSEKKE